MPTMKNTVDAIRPRKRARVSNDADDAAAASGDKKARGRPRVDTEDATAADRRRTQIRLAQRAYRQRKETTISSLKQQNSQLRSVIEQMKHQFSQFNESANQSGLLQLNTELATKLKHLTEIFDKYAKTANECVLDSSEEETYENAPAQQERNAIASAASSKAESTKAITHPTTEHPWGYAALSHTNEQIPSRVDVPQIESYLSHISSSSYNLPEPSNQSSLVRRKQFTVGEVLDQSRSLHVTYDTQTADDLSPHQHQQPLPFGLVDLHSREQSPFVPPYFFSVSIPSIGAELPPPHQSFKTVPHPLIPTLSTKTVFPSYTYSHEEITFARRLTRATLESGFQLLCTSDIHPAILNYVFRLSLPYLTLDEIRTRFKIVLSRGVDEDLDWYSTPFLHLGGAGTHYKRRDSQGKAVPLKNSWTIRQIGPLETPIVRTENVADGQIHDLNGVDLNGFEGEWFDANDVQGYIEEQWHCKIDPKSSFAECLIEEEEAGLTDNEMNTPTLSHESTASITGTSATPPIPDSFNTFEPSYGLDMSFNTAPALNFPLSSPKQSLLDLSFDQTLGLDLAPGFDTGFARNRGPNTLGSNMMGEMEQLPIAKQKQKKVAWVDIQKLIAKMIKRAVCLGRAPGYRRKDVDIAFREALIPTY